MKSLVCFSVLVLTIQANAQRFEYDINNTTSAGLAHGDLWLEAIYHPSSNVNFRPVTNTLTSYSAGAQVLDERKTFTSGSLWVDYGGSIHNVRAGVSDLLFEFAGGQAVSERTFPVGTYRYTFSVEPWSIQLVGEHEFDLSVIDFRANRYRAEKEWTRSDFDISPFLGTWEISTIDNDGEVIETLSQAFEVRVKPPADFLFGLWYLGDVANPTVDTFHGANITGMPFWATGWQSIGQLNGFPMEAALGGGPRPRLGYESVWLPEPSTGLSLTLMLVILGYLRPKRAVRFDQTACPVRPN